MRVINFLNWKKMNYRLLVMVIFYAIDSKKSYGKSVHNLDYGGWGEGEVNVGYEAVAEADAEAAVAGAAYGQEFAFYYGVVVGDAHAAAYDVGEVVVGCGPECDALV